MSNQSESQKKKKKKEQNRLYHQTLKGKEAKKKSFKKYRLTSKGKESEKRYRENHKAGIRKYFQKYFQTHGGKEAKKKACKKYYQTTKGKEVDRRKKAQRRQLGFIPLNNPFEGCEGHHIDIERVIYIPKEIHRSVWHSVSLNVNMDEINKLAFEYLKIENEAKRINILIYA